MNDDEHRERCDEEEKERVSEAQELKHQERIDWISVRTCIEGSISVLADSNIASTLYESFRTQKGISLKNRRGHYRCDIKSYRYERVAGEMHAVITLTGTPYDEVEQ